MLSSFRFIFILSFLLLLSSCFSRPIPPDVINLNDDIDLLKGPRNEDGCTQYFPRSESGVPTIQVIYFYTKKGKITGESDPKECL